MEWEYGKTVFTQYIGRNIYLPDIRKPMGMYPGGGAGTTVFFESIPSTNL